MIPSDAGKDAHGSGSERLLHRIAIIAAILTGILPPLLMAASRYDDLVKQVTQDASIQAALVGRYASINPETWIYKPEHIGDTLRGIRQEGTRTEVESDGKLLISIGNPVAGYAISRSAELTLFGQAAGRTIVTHSAKKVIDALLTAVVVGGLSAALLVWMLYHFVLKRLRAANEARRISTERLLDLVQLSSDWFWEQDAEYRFTKNSYARLGSIEANRLIGKQRWDLPAKLTEEQWAAHRADLDAHRNFTLRYALETRDGERWFEVRGKPLFSCDATFIGYRGIGRDITLDVKRELELTNHRLHLEDMVAERTEQLAIAKDAAESANRAKSTFLSNMSHELRTPLNSILGFTQILQQENLSADVREDVDHIHKSGKHLLTLINEMLDLSRIEAGNLEIKIEVVDIGELQRGVMDAITPLAQRKGVEISCRSLDELLAVEADRNRLHQVLLNLMSNAIKYNRPRGKVEMWAEKRDAMVRISVVDTGIGLSPSDLEQLFTPYTRFGPRNIEGTGIGLTITKRLVEAMGGTIGVLSEVDVGSTFWVELRRGSQPS